MSKKVKPSKKKEVIKEQTQPGLESALKNKSITELREIEELMDIEIEKNHNSQDYKELDLVKAEIKRKNRALQIKKMFMIIPIILILVFLILCIKIEKINTTENITRTVSKSYTVNPEINLREYTKISDLKYTTYISTLGYLREISSGEEVIVTKKYLYDDFENRIELSLNENNFKVPFNTNKTYRVEGNFRNSIDGFKLYVDKIVQENNVPKTMTNTTTINDKIPINTTKVSFNVDYAISKITLI